MSSRGRRRRAFGAAVLALVLIGGCAGDDEGPGSAGTTTSHSVRPTSTGLSSTTEQRNAPATSGPTVSSIVGARGTTTTSTSAASTSTTSGAGEIVTSGEGAATDLSATSECAGTPPRGVARLRWHPSGAGAQRIDVSVLDNGFAPGTYQSSGILGVGAGSLEWDRAEGEATHHWRVLTAVDGGWVASATATFPGPGCVGYDMQP